MNNIKLETFSSLLRKLIMIQQELRSLNHLLIYYSDCGNENQTIKVVDSIRQLEVAQTTICSELDKRFPNNDTKTTSDDGSGLCGN